MGGNLGLDLVIHNTFNHVDKMKDEDVGLIMSSATVGAHLTSPSYDNTNR